MKYIKRCFPILGLAVIASLQAGAQSSDLTALDAAGGSKKLAGITHEFAIGQVMSGDAQYGGPLIVTPGLLQPAGRARFLPEKTIASSELQIFPGPVASTLFLQPAFRRGGTLSYDLYDALGRRIMGRQAVLTEGTEQQQLNVSHLAAGEYLLRVTWLAGLATPKKSGYKILKLH